MKTSVVHVDNTAQNSKVCMFFPEGIIGFDNHKEYSIIKEKSKEPFYWLQSSKDSEVSFIIIDPREFKDDYKPILSELDRTALRIKDIDECCCYVIVCVPQDTNEISANLLAPLMVNKKENIARQVILQEQDYSVQHLVLEEMLRKIEDKNVSSFAQTK